MVRGSSRRKRRTSGRLARRGSPQAHHVFVESSGAILDRRDLGVIDDEDVTPAVDQLRERLRCEAPGGDVVGRDVRDDLAPVTRYVHGEDRNSSRVGLLQMRNDRARITRR